MGPIIKWGCLPSETPLENGNFAFASRCLLATSSWFGIGAHVHILLSALGHHLACTCASLCTLPVSEVLRVPALLFWMTVCPWSHPPPLALTASPPPILTCSLSPEGTSLRKTSPLGCLFVCFLSFHLFYIPTKFSFLLFSQSLPQLPGYLPPFIHSFIQKAAGLP